MFFFLPFQRRGGGLSGAPGHKKACFFERLGVLFCAVFFGENFYSAFLHFVMFFFQKFQKSTVFWNKWFFSLAGGFLMVSGALGRPLAFRNGWLFRCICRWFPGAGRRVRAQGGEIGVCWVDAWAKRRSEAVFAFFFGWFRGVGGGIVFFFWWWLFEKFFFFFLGK